MENAEDCGRHGRAGERAGAEKGRSGREMQNMTDKSGIQRKQTWKILGNGGTGAKKENNKYKVVWLFTCICVYVCVYCWPALNWHSVLTLN